MPTDEAPRRPRRERPLVAPGREQAAPAEPVPPTVNTPPVGRPLIDFGAPEPAPEREDRIHVAFDGPTTQRRWTVAFRIFLLIPHIAWLYLLNLATQVMVFIGWFAALFTGRLPEPFAQFLAKVLRYQTRVFGYGYLLLTDQYPPFDIGADDYAIDVHFAPARLNRAAVFFRLILVIPSVIVAGLAMVGASMIGVVGWLLTLIMGRLPTTLWEANAAVLRYATRAGGFAFMLTAEQPSGLFGDKEGPAPVVDEGLPDLPVRPRISRLVLSKAARRLVGLFIAAAVVTYIGFFVTFAISAARTAGAYNDLRDGHDRLGVSVGRFQAETQRCAINGGIVCLHQADTDLADAFDRFADDVQAISFPAGTDPGIVITDAHACSAALRHMAAAENEAQYGAALGEYQQAANEFDQDYRNVSFDARYSD